MPYAEVVAVEESTFIVDVTCQDEDGNSVTPDSLRWVLRSSAGIVAEGEIETPAAVNPIVLSGTDLALPEGVRAARELAVFATYTSPTTDTELPVVAKYVFHIEPVLAAPEPAE